MRLAYYQLFQVSGLDGSTGGPGFGNGGKEVAEGMSASFHPEQLPASKILHRIWEDIVK